MASLPSVEDLLLVESVARHGSLAAAARELLISQPAASQRLARLERRVGLALFDRDTTGARPTVAGAALVREATHTLQHLDGAFDRARAAAQAPTLRIGAFASLAPLLFPALEVLLPDLGIDQLQDHGNRLVEWVGEGSLDAAFVAIADQLPLPANTTARTVAEDRYVLVLPAGHPAPPGPLRLRGMQVLIHAIDLSTELLHEKVTTLGGTTQRAATSETALRTARVRGTGAIVARSQALAYAEPGESVTDLRLRARPALSLVTRTPVPPALQALGADLARAIGMSPPRRTT